MRQALLFVADAIVREAARDRGHAAATKAGAKAERVSDGWLDRAVALVQRFARENNGSAFLMEDARAFAETEGLVAPPDARAWGAVTQILKRRKVIKCVGYGSAKSSNGSPKCLWQEIA